MGNTPNNVRTLSIYLILSVLSVISISAALWVLRPALSATARMSTGQSKTLDTMPWTFNDVSNGNRLFVTMPVHWFTPTTWHVVPDDELVSLKVNGKSVSLNAIPKPALTNWRKGFEFDFSPWLTNGNNLIEFEVNNYGGPGGISLHPIAGARWILLWLSFLPLLYTLSRLFKLRAHQWLSISLGLIVVCCYWSITPWTTRAHDVLGGDGHIDYIMRVAHTLTLPAPTEKWEFFQPPLYYLGGAVTWRWAEWLHLSPPETVQAYSLSLWIIFLCSSSALINLAVRFRTVPTGLATAAIALWPTGIISSIGINNDVGLYACSSLATLFTVRWWFNNKYQPLFGAAFFIALALLTKTTAMVLVGTLGMLMLIKLMRHQHWREWRRWQPYLIASTMILIGFAASLGRKIYSYWQGSISDWIMGNSALVLGDWLKVPAKLGNFIPMDIATFLSHPWIDLTNDSTGRYNFWNVLLRTSLTGEYSFNGAIQKWIALLWGVILIILLLTLLRRWKDLKSLRTTWRYLPLLIVTTLWFASLISFRIKISYACNNDFRYIFPVIVPFAILCVTTSNVARSLLMSIAFASLLFFTTLSFG